MLKSAYIRQPPDRSWENTTISQYDNNVTSNHEYATINRCVFRLLLEVPMVCAHLIEMGACFRGKGRHAQSNACQNFPGDNEVSSRDVYSQIVETSQICRATVGMTNTTEPCHVEPCRPATRSCILFCAQLAASVDLSILVLYGHISAARRQCAQHCSGSIVAETLNIHWYHTGGCCNNPNGMSLPNLSVFQSWVCQGTFEFYRWNAADSWYFGKICLHDH